MGTETEIKGYFRQKKINNTSEYISFNKIRLAHAGLEHFFSLYGEGILEKPTKAQIRGRIFHEACLEPQRFLMNKHTAPPKLSGKDLEIWTQRVERENSQAYFMTTDEVREIDRMREKVFSHKLVGQILENAIVEKHGYAKCPRTGLMLYSRPDILTKKSYIADLKFVQSADPFMFKRQQYSMLWFVQLAFYNYVHSLITGKPHSENCFFIAVEHRYPHKICVMTLTEKFQRMGEIVFEEMIDKIKACLELDPKIEDFEVWRRDSNNAIDIDPDMWMLNKDPRFYELIDL